MYFSFNRFCYLVKLHLASNLRLYLLSIAALAGVLLAFLLLFALDSGGLRYDEQQIVFVIGLALSGGIYTTTFYRQFTNKKGRIQGIMLPVSAMERIALGILFSLITFPLVYAAVGLFCIRLVNFIESVTTDNLNGCYQLNDKLVPGYLTIYLYLSALCLLGAISFKKQAFVKTAVLVSIIMITVHTVNARMGAKMVATSNDAAKTELTRKTGKKVLELSYDGGTPYSSILLTTLEEQENGHAGTGHYMVQLPPSQALPMSILLLLTPAFLWFVTLLKLREQQV